MRWAVGIGLAGLSFLGAIIPAEAQSASQGWSGTRALSIIEDQLAFGPRYIGSRGHTQVVEYIVTSLAALGLRPELQEWSEQAKPGFLHLTNVVARIFPDRDRRIVLATHFDTIKKAYLDRDNPDATMPGANNGASGVALLIETARYLTRNGLDNYGIDLIFFDGEEGSASMGGGDPNWRALGSPYFVENLYRFYKPDSPPLLVIVFDMVCFRRALFFKEPSSVLSAKSDVEKFWSVGKHIAPDYFRDEIGPEIRDDHTAFVDHGIPAMLIIGFNYAPWYNTTRDTADKCSAATLEGLGNTVIKFLEEAAPEQR